MRHIGAWLLSTLIWLPLLIPLLAMDVHAMPVSSERLSSSAFVVAGWVLTGLFGSYVPSGRWRMVFRGAAHGLAFLVAFFVAYGTALSIPLTQGWFGGGAAPVALNATFTQVFSVAIVTACAFALGLAVDAALGTGVDVGLVVAASLGLGVGVVTVDRVSPYSALALAPVVVYGVAALLKPDACVRLRMNAGVTALRVAALVVLLLSFAGLVWLCLLKRAPGVVVAGEASDGEEALALIEALRPDVVVLDCEMPGPAGVEAAQEIRRRNLPVRVLALSAYDSEQYVRGMLETGAVGYLLKDEAPGVIVAAVQAAVRGEGYFSPKIAAKVAALARGERPAGLTEREVEVLRLVAEDRPTDWRSFVYISHHCAQLRAKYFEKNEVWQSY